MKSGIFGWEEIYSFDEIIKSTTLAGFIKKDYVGIRILADYMDSAPTEALLKAEMELGNREPYQRFGRYYQFAFGRNSGD